MKAEQIDKLYSKLTSQENAALAFEALVRHDFAEVDVIEGAVGFHARHVPNTVVGLHFALAWNQGFQHDAQIAQQAEKQPRRVAPRE